MHRYVEKIAHLLIAFTFFAPLVVLPTSFIFPFIVPKILFFRTIALLLLGSYVLLLLGNWQKYRLRYTPLTSTVLLFFFSFALSTFIGVDWYRSFWDNHERMLGLFTLFHYILYYLVVSSVVTEWKDWRRLLRVFLFFGSIVMFIGLLQRGNPELLLNRGAVRVSSTLGNAIYVGGYGLFLLFLGALLAVKEEARRWKIFAIVGALFGFLGIFLSETRGTMLGLAAALAVMLIMYFFLLDTQAKRVRWSFLTILVIGIVLSGLFIGFRQTSFVKNIPVLGRFSQISFENLSTNTRIMAWDIALESWKEKPIFGWGPGNYFYSFNKYYRAEFLRHGWAETWFDNAHNVVMNTLATQGAFGLLTYLGMFVVGMWQLAHAYKKQRIDKHFFAFGVGFLVGHFIHNIFVFENPTSYLYFFLFLACINTQTREKQAAEVQGAKKISLPSAVITILIILFIIYVTNINPGRANQQTLDFIRKTVSGGDPVELYKQLTIPTPHRDDVWSDVVRNTQPRLAQLMQQNKKEEALALAEMQQELLSENKAVHPFDIRTHIHQAEIAMLMASIASGQLQFAENVMTEAHTLSPERQQVTFLLAAIQLQLGKIDEAVALIQKTIDDDPLVSEGWWRLALLQMQLGRTENALQIIDEAETRGIRFRPDGQQAVNQIRAAAKATSTQK